MGEARRRYGCGRRTGQRMTRVRESAQVDTRLAAEFAERYAGQVKLIYADPPFNTGQTFAHYDDWMEHATWLSFMRDRLILMRELLAPDGSIWIHLDDAEQHRMRLLMDEVFGAENFITTVIWEKTYAPRNDAKTFSSSHDYILVYSRSGPWRSNRLPRTD
ncbi:MAG: hypothetical protein B7X10_01730, partial [Burkholderiales bacterium 21-58-4]